MQEYKNRHNITSCRSAGMRRRETAGADRFRRNVGQRGQLREHSRRVDCGIVLQDDRPVGESAWPNKSPCLHRTFKKSTITTTLTHDYITDEWKKREKLKEMTNQPSRRNGQLFDQLSEFPPSIDSVTVRAESHLRNKWSSGSTDPCSMKKILKQYLCEIHYLSLLLLIGSCLEFWRT